MKLPKPYNNYNLFFILERALLLDSRKDYTEDSSSRPSSPASFVTGYEGLELPPLPPRYRHLVLPHNWYDPMRKRFVKRKHVKDHGVASFQEIAKTVASNWRTIDPITKDYIQAVVVLIKDRHSEIETSSDIRDKILKSMVVHGVANGKPEQQAAKIPSHSISEPSLKIKASRRTSDQTFDRVPVNPLSSTDIKAQRMSDRTFDLMPATPNSPVDFTCFPCSEPATRPNIEELGNFFDRSIAPETCLSNALRSNGRGMIREVNISNADILNCYFSD